VHDRHDRPGQDDRQEQAPSGTASTTSPLIGPAAWPWPNSSTVLPPLLTTAPMAEPM
jgi:hypothetical protein